MLQTSSAEEGPEKVTMYGCARLLQGFGFWLGLEQNLSCVEVCTSIYSHARAYRQPTSIRSSFELRLQTVSNMILGIIIEYYCIL
jgi:hypothetical protein